MHSMKSSKNPAVIGFSGIIEVYNRDAPAVLETPRGVTPKELASMFPKDTSSEIPYGYCHCGCGQKTTLATTTWKRKGWVRGQPYQYLPGHNRAIGHPQLVYRDDHVLVPLTGSKGRGLHVAIDFCDVDRVLQHRWTLWVSKSGGQYARSTIDGSNIRIHRFLLSPKHNEMVDHKDGDGLNNRRSNLRICTSLENARNSRACGGLSIYRGIHFRADRGGRWCAQINAGGKRYGLGSFQTEMDAAKAYDIAARLLHGDFAAVNFPRKGERSALAAQESEART